MITAQDLQEISLFANMCEADRDRLARKAGDVRLAAGDWLFREGEHPYFQVLLVGQLSVHKNYLGRLQEMTKYGVYQAGDFFGEVPILLGSRTFISMKADIDCRVARFEAQLLHWLMRESSECNTCILDMLNKRLSRTHLFYRETAATRVHIIGSQRDYNCRDICHFLSLNRITYEWADRDQFDHIPVGLHGKSPVIVIDGSLSLTEMPTVRGIADALGIRTCPEKTHYDVIIVGGGPAGLAAAVYGASEGLSVLMVERNAAGGQAGSSARIENYLGFPDGISGDDMSERALRQAERFGAEMVLTREVTRIERMTDGSYCCNLDGGDRLTSMTIILATGVNWRCIDAEGIDRLRGRGVLYGAAKTEAAMVIGRDIFIVGGGNSAGQAAVFFANYANTVTILVRGDGLMQTMSQYLIEQIKKKGNILVEPHTKVIAAEGENQLESITTVTSCSGEQEQVKHKRKADALFILIGATAKTGWLPRELQRDEHGFIYTGHDVSDVSNWKGTRRPYLLETSLPGFFCAGDVRHDSIKRVSSGVGEGGMAIAFVHQYLGSRQT